jgi:putative transposase
VNRDFSAQAPNRLWLVDFTYVPTWSGMAFTAFVSDAYSRRIVGWRVASSMPTSLPLDALEMALWTRERAGHASEGRLEGLIQHSDAGSQYTSLRYSQRLADAGAVASIGSVGDSYDNAQAESLIGLYKLECVRRDGPWRGVDDLELATLNWIHWFNHQRLHSKIGYISPAEYEAEHYRSTSAAFSLPITTRRAWSTSAPPTPGPWIVPVHVDDRERGVMTGGPSGRRSALSGRLHRPTGLRGHRHHDQRRARRGAQGCRRKGPDPAPPRARRLKAGTCPTSRPLSAGGDSVTDGIVDVSV